MFGWLRGKKQEVVECEGKRFPCPKKGCDFVAENGSVLGGHMTRKDHRRR